MKNTKNRSNRLDAHFAICAVAMATGAAVGTANATVIYSGPVNLAVPVTMNGIYMNVQTGAFATLGSLLQGWDVNPYGTSSTTVSLYAANGTGYMRNPDAGTSTGRTNLSVGTIVGSTSFFYGSSTATIGTLAGQWSANSSGFFGFKFLAADNATHYGWMRLSIGANAATRTIVDYAWEDVAGTSIVVPAPGAMALIGLAGFWKRRRRS